MNFPEGKKRITRRDPTVNAFEQHGTFTSPLKCQIMKCIFKERILVSLYRFPEVRSHLYLQKSIFVACVNFVQSPKRPTTPDSPPRTTHPQPRNTETSHVIYNIDL
jgi:hypothetical protein